MKLKEMTLNMASSILEAPIDDLVHINRELASEIYELLYSLTLYYGPQTTVSKLNKIFFGDKKHD